MVAPVLNPSFNPSAGSYTEGLLSTVGVTVAGLVVDGSITDSDGVVEAIAVTSLNGALGTWQYSLNNGLAWFTIRADLLNSATNELALLLGPTARLRLHSFGDLNGSVAAALTFRAWDQSDGGVSGTYRAITASGGLTAYSAASDTASASVSAVNDAPSFAPGFGPGNGLGFGQTNLDVAARQVLVQPDGRVVIGGTTGSGGVNDFHAFRLLANGTELDSGFGSNGLVFSGAGDTPYSSLLQVDGKLLLTGSSSNLQDVEFLRLTSSGTPDASFNGDGNGDGRVVIDASVGDVDLRFRAALLADGRIVAAGSSNVDGWYYSVVRLNADGSLDPSFGNAGRKAVYMLGATASAMSVDAADRVVVGGIHSIAFGQGSLHYVALMRLAVDGQLDAAFNGDGDTDGLVFQPLSGVLGAGADLDVIAQQPDGKLLLAGAFRAIGSTTWDLTLLRLNVNGSLDTSFDGDGRRILATAEASSATQRSLLLLPDGKILVNSDHNVYRLNSDGSTDAVFDIASYITISSLALQPDGKIVVAGNSGPTAYLVRLGADGNIDNGWLIPSGDSLGAVAAYTENAAPVVLDSSVQLRDADLAALNNGQGNYAGSTLTLARSGGASASDLFSGIGALAFVNGQVQLSGVTIGSLGGSFDATRAIGTLTIAFNANATHERVNQALSSLGYASISEAPPASINIAWTFNDGGNQGSGGALAASGTSTVNFSAVNDAPLLNSASAAALPGLLENDSGGNGITVAALLADGAISDVDLIGTAPEAIALMATDVSLGLWQFSTDGGSSWISVRSELLNSGTESLALLLSPTHRLRLLPFGELSGSLAQALSFRAWDGSDGAGAGSYTLVTATGGTSAYSSAADTASIAVAAVNDAPSFAPATGNGTLVFSFGADSQGEGMALRADGAIVVASTSAAGYGAARITGTGVLDAGFDGDGRAVIAVQAIATTQHLALQPDGRVLVAGSSGQTMGVARLSADGSPDASFDGDGRRVVSVGSSSGAAFVGVTADDKVVLGGNAIVGGQASLAVVRLNANGSLDSGFDQDGVFTLTGGRLDTAVLEPSGALLAAGIVGADFQIVRVLASGALDGGFGSDGLANLAISAGIDQPSAMLRQADGKIVVAGVADAQGANPDFAVVRLNPDGNPDPSFSGDGIERIAVGSGNSIDRALGIALQADGRLVVVGSTNQNGTDDIAIVRLNANGGLDTSFDGDGKLVVAGPGAESAGDVLVQPDGRIVVHATRTTSDELLLLRLEADGSPDPTFAGSALPTLGDSAAYTEGEPPVALDTSVALRDIDLAPTSTSGDYAGASLLLQRSGGADAQDLFGSSGALSLTGGVAALGGVPIATLSNAGGTLALAFNANATPERLTQALSSLTYANASAAPPPAVSLQWTFSDGNAGAQGTGPARTASGTTTVLITAVNNAPLTAPLALATPEDVVLQASLGASDPEGAALIYGVVMAPLHGSVTIGADGNFRYAPATHFNGGDSFSYVAGDGTLVSPQTLVSISVAAVNDAPTAQPQALATAEDVALAGQLTGSDIEGSALRFMPLTMPEHGTLVLQTNGAFSYTPDADFFGNDGFAFSSHDAALSSAPALVSLTVGSVNDAPLAQTLHLATDEDTPASGALTASDVDGDALSFALATPPLHGTVELQPGGSFLYRPAANYSGSDAFSFTAHDGTLTSAAATVSVTVASVNDAPGLADLMLQTNEDMPLDALLAATDADGDAPIYELVGGPAHGTALVSAGGQLRYVPAPDFHGSDSFSVRARDATLGGAPATVTVAVVPVNDAPVAADAAASTPRETLLEARLPAARDADGDAVSYALALPPSHGSVTVFADGRYRYQPEAGYEGGDTFSFRVSDPSNAGSVGRMDLSIIGDALPRRGTEQAEAMGPRDQADRYEARGGNDTVMPGAGNDTVDGGDGFDWVSYADGAAAIDVDLRIGRVVRGEETDILAGIEAVVGGAGGDHLVGDENMNAFIGGGGADTIEGLGGLDWVDYRGEGGAAAPLRADLSAGSGTIAGVSDLLLGIEAVFGTAGDDQFIGQDGGPALSGERFRGGPGNDSLNGAGGNDTAEFDGPLSEFTIAREAGPGLNLRVTHLSPDGDGSDTLDNIERLIFTDKLVAFGPRAEEVARVAFVLWTPQIVGSSALFARGLSFYDVGYDFETLCSVVLQFWPQQGEEFARVLLRGTPGTARSLADVMAIIDAAAHSDAGRAAAVAAMAFDAATTEQLRIMGVTDHGLVAELSVPGFGVLFQQLGG